MRLTGFALFALLLATLNLAACSTGPNASPSDPLEQAVTTAITVPDEISHLDSVDVERRLGRLLDGGENNGLAAPGVEPTPAEDEPSLQEILDLLDSANQQPQAREIVISVSPQTLVGLREPVLTIKTQPVHGRATVIGTTRIVYVANGPAVEGDSFQYEMFDGPVPVFSNVVEIR